MSLSRLRLSLEGDYRVESIDYSYLIAKSIMALKSLKRHSIKIPARYAKAFSGFDTFCQYLKIEFIDLANYSQKELLKELNT